MGILVASLLEPLTPTLVADLPYQSNKQVAIAIGDARIQGVYAAYIGTIGTALHKEFLREVIENHVFLEEQSAKGCARTCGDFNLTGVAPGTGRLPKTGTAHCMTQQPYKV